MSQISTAGMQISKRYADALIALAQEKKLLDKIQSDVSSMRDLLNGSSDLLSMIESPLFRRAQQEKAILAIAKKAKYTPLFTDFLATLAQNKRLALLPGILVAAQNACQAMSGTEEAEVISASALSDKDAKALEGSIKKMVGKDISMTLRVDESLLGGVIVKVGSRMIDDSVRTKLDRLERVLRSGQTQELTSTQNLKEVG